MVSRKIHPKRFFTEKEKARITRAIRAAEQKTSGEIRIYLEYKAKGNVIERAKRVFEKLGMTKTEKRNGILIYFSLHDRNFAVLGDRGIHEKVGNDFWKSVALKMQDSFLRDDFVGGLEAGVREMGERLKKYFPRESGDVNELSNEVKTS